MQFLHVDAEIGFASARGGAEFTAEHGLVRYRVDQSVRLQAVGLRESGVTDLTLIRLLPGVDSQMSLQFECVGASVGAVRTL